jgi:predicted aspartyl protease
MPMLPIPLLPAGAFLDVGVGASRTFTSPANRPNTWKALVDTGADMTVISPSVVSALQPQQIGNVPVSRAGSMTVWRGTYDVRIRFGGHAGPGRWYSVEAIEVQPAAPDVDVLIGMDLLIEIDMAWIGSRRLVLLNH